MGSTMQEVAFRQELVVGLVHLGGNESLGSDLDLVGEAPLLDLKLAFIFRSERSLEKAGGMSPLSSCLLYTSDAADE